MSPQRTARQAVTLVVLATPPGNLVGLRCTRLAQRVQETARPSAVLHESARPSLLPRAFTPVRCSRRALLIASAQSMAGATMAACGFASGAASSAPAPAGTNAAQTGVAGRATTYPVRLLAWGD